MLEFFRSFVSRENLHEDAENSADKKKRAQGIHPTSVNPKRPDANVRRARSTMGSEESNRHDDGAAGGVEQPAEDDSAFGSGAEDDDEVGDEAAKPRRMNLRRFESKEHLIGDEEYLVVSFVGNVEISSRKAQPREGFALDEPSSFSASAKAAFDTPTRYHSANPHHAEPIKRIEQIAEEDAETEEAAAEDARIPVEAARPKRQKVAVGLKERGVREHGSLPSPVTSSVVEQPTKGQEKKAPAQKSLSLASAERPITATPVSRRLSEPRVSVEVRPKSPIVGRPRPVSTVFLQVDPPDNRTHRRYGSQGNLTDDIIVKGIVAGTRSFFESGRSSSSTNIRELVDANSRLSPAGMGANNFESGRSSSSTNVRELVDTSARRSPAITIRSRPRTEPSSKPTMDEEARPVVAQKPDDSNPLLVHYKSPVAQDVAKKKKSFFKKKSKQPKEEEPVINTVRRTSEAETSSSVEPSAVKEHRRSSSDVVLKSQHSRQGSVELLSDLHDHDDLSAGERAIVVGGSTLDKKEAQFTSSSEESVGLGATPEKSRKKKRFGFAKKNKKPELAKSSDGDGVVSTAAVGKKIDRDGVKEGLKVNGNAIEKVDLLPSPGMSGDRSATVSAGVSPESERSPATRAIAVRKGSESSQPSRGSSSSEQGDVKIPDNNYRLPGSNGDAPLSLVQKFLNLEATTDVTKRHSLIEDWPNSPQQRDVEASAAATIDSPTNPFLSDSEDPVRGENPFLSDSEDVREANPFFSDSEDNFSTAADHPTSAAEAEGIKVPDSVTAEANPNVSTEANPFISEADEYAIAEDNPFFSETDESLPAEKNPFISPPPSRKASQSGAPDIVVTEVSGDKTIVKDVHTMRMNGVESGVMANGHSHARVASEFVGEARSPSVRRGLDFADLEDLDEVGEDGEAAAPHAQDIRGAGNSKETEGKAKKKKGLFKFPSKKKKKGLAEDVVHADGKSSVKSDDHVLENGREHEKSSTPKSRPKSMDVFDLFTHHQSPLQRTSSSGSHQNLPQRTSSEEPDLNRSDSDPSAGKKKKKAGFFKSSHRKEGKGGDQISSANPAAPGSPTSTGSGYDTIHRGDAHS